MRLEIDPDGAHEDRAEILAKKLVTDNITLQCPTLLIRILVTMHLGFDNTEGTTCSIIQS